MPQQDLIEVGGDVIKVSTGGLCIVKLDNNVEIHTRLAGKMRLTGFGW